jgi:hypothetical protein
MELEQEPTTVILGGVMHQCGHPDIPLAAAFRFLPEDSAAVTIDFAGPLNDETWRFGRDLLRLAYEHPEEDQGLGDVRAAYLAEHEVFRLTLIGVNSSCAIYFEAETVKEFVDHIHALVPAGSEVVDVDSWLEELK